MTSLLYKCLHISVAHSNILADKLASHFCGLAALYSCIGPLYFIITNISTHTQKKNPSICTYIRPTVDLNLLV